MTDLFAEDLAAIEEVDPNKDYYEELVGEGKKYADQKALAYSRIVADNHIKKLEAEQAAARREIDARINMEQFLDQLKAVKSQLSNPGSQDQEDQHTDKSALTPEQLEQLVATKLNQFDAQKTAVQNTEQVMDKLRQVHGPNYVQKLRQDADAMSMTENEARALAAKNPKAFYKLFGLDQQNKPEGFSAPPRTQTNSFALPTGPKKGYSYYWDTYYKKDPREFFSSKVQNEMSQRMQEMGKEAFLNS